MARDESRREDLLREATAFVERIELVPSSSTSKAAETPIVVGFRADGALSVFFGEDPAYQFNAAGELLRVLRRIAAQGRSRPTRFLATRAKRERSATCTPRANRRRAERFLGGDEEPPARAGGNARGGRLRNRASVAPRRRRARPRTDVAGDARFVADRRTPERVRSKSAAVTSGVRSEAIRSLRIRPPPI